MNRKRSCPGVPNRYSHRFPGRAIRPKSIATVVEVFRSDTPPASSMPTECSVIAASVDSGSMSEIDPMNVVLPTAKPPATTILTVVGAELGEAWEGTGCAPVPGAWARSERGNAIENTLQNAQRRRRVVGGVGVRQAVDGDEVLVAEVADQDPGHPHGKVQVRRQLGDRHVVTGEFDDLTAFAGEQAVGRAGGPDQRLDRQRILARPGSSTRDRVGTDRPGLLPGVLRRRSRRAGWRLVRVRRHRRHPAMARVGPDSGRRARISEMSCGVRVTSVRLTSSAISYPTRPTSQVASASTDSTEPSEMLIRKRNWVSISTI